MKRTEGFNRIKISLSFLIAAILVTALIPSQGKFKYEYKKGRPWKYETLIAPVDFPILKSEQELRDERESRASEVIPYFIYNADVSSEQLRLLWDQASKVGVEKEIIDNISSSFGSIYERGLVETFVESEVPGSLIVVKRDRVNSEMSVMEIFRRDGAVAFIRDALLRQFPEIELDAIIEKLRINDLLVPNLKFDADATELAHKSALDYISPSKGMIYSGQLIVTEGETVTADIEQLLDSFRAEYNISLGFSGSIILLKGGHFLLVASLLLILFVTLFFLKIEVFLDMNKLHFMLVQFVLVALITVVIRDINPKYLYLVPFSVIALYVTSFFATKIVIPLYLIFLTPLLLIAQNGLELYILNAFAGAVAILTFTWWDRGWLQFVNSFFIFIALSLAYISFRLTEDGSISSVDSSYLVYLFWNALFVVGSYPLLFLFEKIFGLVSNSRLRDLSDTNSPLMQSLAENAPGTFHHSLQVATLAESAAREIGAYALLARVGALYHDIGKMSNPLCFIENQQHGNEFHKGLTPQESARYIIQHVDDGVTIAKKSRLPQIIIDFILSHHAKSRTDYFFNQYINSGGDDSEAADFTYNGILPSYKEQVIVMMADAVEAASRSLRDFSEKSVSDLVEKMANTRIFDEQLINADISVKEIFIIKEVFKKRLMQAHHSRIKYPERKR